MQGIFLDGTMRCKSSCSSTDISMGLPCRSTTTLPPRLNDALIAGIKRHRATLLIREYALQRSWKMTPVLLASQQHTAEKGKRREEAPSLQIWQQRRVAFVAKMIDDDRYLRYADFTLVAYQLGDNGYPTLRHWKRLIASHDRGWYRISHDYLAVSSPPAREFQQIFRCTGRQLSRIRG